jgi:hypothetical protein
MAVPQTFLQPRPAMTDLAPPRERLEKPTLTYPFAAAPDVGTVLEVAPGVVWMRMPLPFALDHINIWGLEEEAGWAVVDTGMGTDETLAAWRALFAGTTEQRPLTRVFGTHMHPDHIGMAGWLTRKFGCRLWMTQLEYLNCRVLTADTGRGAPEDGITFYRRAGWSPAAIEGLPGRFGNFGKRIHALPDSYRRIVDGETIRIGAPTWRVNRRHRSIRRSTPALYCADLKLLISATRVLPAFRPTSPSTPRNRMPTPCGSGWSPWPSSNARCPMTCWSCPRTTTVSGDCTPGWTTWRLRRSARWTACARRCRNPGAPWMCLPALFGRAIDEADAGLLNLATGESLACMNYLWHSRGGAEVAGFPPACPGTRCADRRTAGSGAGALSNRPGRLASGLLGAS